MKIANIVLGIAVFLGTKPMAQAQADSPETLQWVEYQSRRIDTLLDNAILSHEHVDLILKLTDAYLLFDVVALAGVYCPEVREAAKAGSKFSDVVNYRLEKDLNSSVVRATQARLQAEKMRLAAQKCRPAAPQTAFTPADVIREEAHIAELLLSDGLAVGDFHLLSQKLEQSIRALHDIEHLASTFQNCPAPADAAARAVLQCEAALAGRNWMEVKAAVTSALEEVKAIATMTCS